MFASIDPGVKTGVARFDRNGNLRALITVTYKNAIEYSTQLNKIKSEYAVVFALIERYSNNGKRFRSASKVQTQITLCREVFPEHILVYNAQWNGNRYSAWGKKEIIKMDFGIQPASDHEADCGMMGRNIFNLAKQFGTDPFSALYKLSTGKKRWPTKKSGKFYEELSRLSAGGA